MLRLAITEVIGGAIPNHTCSRAARYSFHLPCWQRAIRHEWQEPRDGDSQRQSHEVRGSLLHDWAQRMGSSAVQLRSDWHDDYSFGDLDPTLWHLLYHFLVSSVPVWHAQHDTSFSHAGPVKQIPCDMSGNHPGVPWSNGQYPAANQFFTETATKEEGSLRWLTVCSALAQQEEGSTWWMGRVAALPCMCVHYCSSVVYEGLVLWGRLCKQLAPTFMFSSLMSNTIWRPR